MPTTPAGEGIFFRHSTLDISMIRGMRVVLYIQRMGDISCQVETVAKRGLTALCFFFFIMLCAGKIGARCGCGNV